MNLPEQRQAEIAAKLRSLDDELDHWREVTERAELGLRRHYVQVRRLAASLEGLTQSIRAEINSESELVLEKAEHWETKILAAHSIWETFRAKLVLREDIYFREVLAACDDFAWACYGPAVERFDRNRRGPPLVYFTSTWSPFAMSRDGNFQNEVRAGSGTSNMLGEDSFQDVLRRLPIPLIGVPWYQAFHLPGALIIAHEAGHIVEFDFGLTRDIAAALERAQLANLASWTAWMSEVFADLYGCLCAGPAFVGVMLNLLATSVATVRHEERRGGRYPTRALRVELMLEALCQLGHKDESRRLRSTWEDTYGAMRVMLEYRPDLPKVVKAIYAGPYKGIPLTELPKFPPDAIPRLRAIGEAAARNHPMLADYEDPRELFAAAQWLHENPQPRQHTDAFKLIVAQTLKRGLNQFRMRGEPVPDIVAIEAELRQMEALDRQRGRKLADDLLH